MAKILLTRPFVRWMQTSGLSEVALVQAVEEMEAGLVDANLGGNLFKKSGTRWARQAEWSAYYCGVEVNWPLDFFSWIFEIRTIKY